MDRSTSGQRNDVHSDERQRILGCSAFLPVGGSPRAQKRRRHQTQKESEAHNWDIGRSVPRKGLITLRGFAGEARGVTALTAAIPDHCPVDAESFPPCSRLYSPPPP